MKMQRRLLSLLSMAALALGLGTLADTASAQAVSTASGPGFYVSVGGTASAFQVDYGKRIDYGATAFSDLHFVGRFGIEGEARFLRYHTDEQVTQTTYLIGPEVYAFRHGAIKPYAKFLVGNGRMNFPFGYATGSYFVMAPGAGVDIKVLPRVDVRLVDFEYQSWPQFTYGNLHPYGVSAGISIRLTRPSLFRKDPYIY